MQPQTLAQVLIATNEGITLASEIDGEDLYRPFLEMVMANVEPATDKKAKPRQQRGG